ncbi:hypothetical protein L0F63_002764 [Massospora cicadina]|nr:hypothetical protein L0F63_002764 [Massospora cicadina]
MGHQFTNFAVEYLDGLSGEQLDAVTSKSGKLFVSAGPGSGDLSAAAYGSLGDFPSVLVITFTNKAAQELKERLGNLLTNAIAAFQGSNSTPASLEKIKRLIIRRHLYIGTFHSLCYRMLLRFAPNYLNASQFSILDISDSKQLVRLALDQLKRASTRLGVSEQSFKLFNVNTFLSAVNELKQSHRQSDRPIENLWGLYNVQLFTKIVQKKTSFQDETGELCQLYTEVYQRYTSMMKAAKQLDFDDLLQWAIHLLYQMPPFTHGTKDLPWLTVSELYVDEFQDTNCLQLEFLSTLQHFCSHAPLPLSITLVGDPDQTIFSWRNFQPAEGSKLPTLFGKDTFPTLENGWEVLFLTINFRSTLNVTTAAGAVIGFDSSHAKRSSAATQSMVCQPKAAGPKVVMMELSTSQEELAFVVNEIQRLRTSSEHLGVPFYYRDVAVLMRAAGTSFSLSKQFASAGIPCTGDLLAYLRLLRNPSDLPSLLRAINVPPRKVGMATMVRLQEFATSSSLPALDALLQLLDGSEPKTRLSSDEVKLCSTRGLKEFAAAIKAMRIESTAPGCTLGSLLNSILSLTGYEDYLATLLPSQDAEGGADNPCGHIMNLKQLVAKITPAQLEFGEQGSGIFSLMDAIDCLLESAGLGHPTDEVSTNATPDAVSISTLHSSKGLEWPILFIMGAHSGSIPHCRCTTRDAIDEEARLLYVGVTRCQYQLYISWARYAEFGGRHQEQSPFLSNLPHSILASEPPSIAIPFWEGFASTICRPFERLKIHCQLEPIADTRCPKRPKRRSVRTPSHLSQPLHSLRIQLVGLYQLHH